MTSAEQHEEADPGVPRPAVLRVEGLRVDRLGQPVVRGVDLSVAPGEVTVLLGANGAGKSTLLDGISGVVIPSAGRVVLGGEDITQSSRRRRFRAGLSYVQQGRMVFEGLTVEENFLVTAGRAELSPAFELFPELKARSSTPAGLLSGGEQQMVVLGRAVVREPRVLMIDELSLGLAPAVIDRMLQAVEHMASSGIGLLLVEQFADRALNSGTERWSWLAVKSRCGARRGRFSSSPTGCAPPTCEPRAPTSPPTAASGRPRPTTGAAAHEREHLPPAARRDPASAGGVPCAPHVEPAR
ncbi:ABC transporter ATP-binding protein [Candidatus Poriferisodalis sp.]|uniref:ABC transporter ATP-binding protein n=1 Tax=Candidatus Poriferisodalis sp. TaxID=3101277 RepID=UPI003B02025C